MTGDPTIHEVLRRLNEYATNLQDFVREMREERRKTEQTYVRRDVYEAETKTRAAELQALRDDLGNEITARQEEQKSKRVLTIGIVVAAFGAVASPIATAILNKP